MVATFCSKKKQTEHKTLAKLIKNQSARINKKNNKRNEQIAEKTI